MLFDILMPFYGRVDQFKLAVESVLAQTDSNWRLTVVDDQYPDGSAAEWLLARKDGRIRYVRNDINLGVSGNFRQCVDLMQAEYGVIMGCDDVMLPNYVSRVRTLLDQYPTASIVQPGVSVIDDSGELVRPLADRVKHLYRPNGLKPALLQGQYLAASLSRGNWAYFPSLVWRTETIKKYGFRADLEVALDLALLLEITAGGGSLVLDDEVVFHYRRHKSSVSAVTAIDGTRFVEEKKVLESASAVFTSLGWAHASRVAGFHVSSRLNALSLLPTSLRSRRAGDTRLLISHIFDARRKSPGDDW